MRQLFVITYVYKAWFLSVGFCLHSLANVMMFLVVTDIDTMYIQIQTGYCWCCIS